MQNQQCRAAGADPSRPAPLATLASRQLAMQLTPRLLHSQPACLQAEAGLLVGVVGAVATVALGASMARTLADPLTCAQPLPPTSGVGAPRAAARRVLAKNTESSAMAEGVSLIVGAGWRWRLCRPQRASLYPGGRILGLVTSISAKDDSGVIQHSFHQLEPE